MSKRRGRARADTGSPRAPHTVDLAASWKRERPDLDEPELLLQIYFMRLGRILEAAYDKRCRRAHGVSGAEMRVLFALRRAGPPYSRRPTDLFRALLVTSGAITKQVDRLQAAGFVSRLPDPSFGGGFLIRLTDKGREAADAMVEELARSQLRSATSKFDRGEIQAAVSFCAALLDSLEDEQSGGGA